MWNTPHIQASWNTKQSLPEQMNRCRVWTISMTEGDEVWWWVTFFTCAERENMPCVMDYTIFTRFSTKFLSNPSVVASTVEWWILHFPNVHALTKRFPTTSVRYPSWQAASYAVCPEAKTWLAHKSTTQTTYFYSKSLSVVWYLWCVFWVLCCFTAVCLFVAVCRWW